METIKTIVDYLDIPRKRQKAELNRRDITKCNVSMSNMSSMDRHVAMYAYDIDRLNFLLSENNTEHLPEIHRLQDEIHQLEKCKGVREFKFVQSYKKTLEDQISDYYKTIQIDLRRELLDMTLPEIYVNQGRIAKMDPKLQIGKHIITPGTIMAAYEDDFDTMIYPAEEVLTSARSCRHFYNQISFKYLEQLTEDYSYDLEGKDLGKVRILTK